MEQAVAKWRELLAPAYAIRTALVLLGIWLNAADGLVTVTLMPSVARDLGGVAYYGWAVAFFLTASILAGASAGQLSQRLGLRTSIVSAGLIYSAGCIVSATSGGVIVFLVGRAVQGAGAGWIVGFCYVAIEATFPERLWARLFALAAGTWGIASVLGPLVGGFFATGAAWRGAFWVFGVQGLLFAAASGLLLVGRPRGSERPPRLAWRTLTTMTVSVALVAAANVTRSVAVAWVLLVAGSCAFVAALRVNQLPDEGLLPRDAARPWTTAGAGYAMIFALEVGTVGLNVYQAAILQSVYSVSAIVAGYVVCSMAMGWTAAAFFVSGAPDRRHSSLIVTGAVVVLLGYFALTITIARSPLYSVAIAGLSVGIGFGLSWSLLTRRIVGALPEGERALGASAVPTTQLLGGALGAAGAGALANMLGLARDFNTHSAIVASPILFGSFLPVIALGVVAALRVARRAVQP